MQQHTFGAAAACGPGGGGYDAYGVWCPPRLISPPCSHCGAGAEHVLFLRDGCMTAAASAAVLDQYGQQHLHDDNYAPQMWQCTQCSKIMKTTRPHKCWCGWVQTGTPSLLALYGSMWDPTPTTMTTTTAR
jgi:hypothetical protein